MAAKKVDTVSDKKSIDDFKQAIVDLGIKLCEEIVNGHARNNESNLNAIVGLYNAIKS